MMNLKKPLLLLLTLSFLLITGCSGNSSDKAADQTANTTEEQTVVTQNPASAQSTSSGGQSPVADAGPDQYQIDANGNNSENITLNGSASSDPDNDIRSYRWQSDGNLIATGVNPEISLGIGDHRIYLIVIDNEGNHDFDSVDITVAESTAPSQPVAPPPVVTPPPVAQNQPPVVINPNDNQNATVGTAFSYDTTQNGSTFNDPDNDVLNYSVSLTPNNLGLSNQNTSITGTPISAGTVQVTITADDNRGGIKTDQFNIVIADPVVTPPPPPPAQGPSTGRVNFWQFVGSEFDSVVTTADANRKQWISDHYHRLLTFSRFFDSHTQWYKGGWEYQNFYGITPTEFNAINNPDWILKDSNGNRLYIPFGCNNGSCARYAMDFGNQGFRNWWINNMRTVLNRGDYKGIFLDDVNLTFRSSNGSGNQVLPIDPRTGAIMTQENWQKYMVQFLEQIQSNFPDVEKTFNIIWFADETSNPYILRQIDAADYIHLERGFMDHGLRGSGRFSLDNFHAFIDLIHARGKKFVASGEATNINDRNYDLANYFLMTKGQDLLGEENNNWTLPSNWWAGFDTDLGAAQGPRYVWNGAIRRDFANGIVLVNPPDRQTLNLTLDQNYRRLDGSITSNILLSAKRGAVLLKAN